MSGTLPKLPEGWEWVRLEDLAADEPHSFTDGPFGSNLKTAHYTESGPRVIRLQNIGGNGDFVDERAHISQERFEQLRKHEARAGDIVIAALGEVLPRACLVPDGIGPAIVKADCPRLRPGPRVNPRFLVHVLNSPIVRQQAAIAGIGRPRLNLGKLRKLFIPLAPLDQQDRLVAVVDRYQADVGAGIKDIQMAEGMLDMLEAALLDEAIETASSAAKLVALGDVVERMTSGSRDWKPYYGRGAGVFVLAQNVRERRLDFTNMMHVDPPVEDPARVRSAVRQDDVLVTIVGAGTGTVARVEEDLLDHWVCQSVALIRPARDSLAGAYLEVFLSAPSWGRRLFGQLMYGQGRPHLSFAGLKALEMPLPPVDVQLEVVAVFRRQLQTVDALRRDLGRTRDVARKLADGVLRAATYGELPLDDGSPCTMESETSHHELRVSHA